MKCNLQEWINARFAEAVSERQEFIDEYVAKGYTPEEAEKIRINKMAQEWGEQHGKDPSEFYKKFN